MQGPEQRRQQRQAAEVVEEGRPGLVGRDLPQRQVHVRDLEEQVEHRDQHDEHVDHQQRPAVVAAIGAQHEGRHEESGRGREREIGLGVAGLELERHAAHDPEPLAGGPRRTAEPEGGPEGTRARPRGRRQAGQGGEAGDAELQHVARPLRRAAREPPGLEPAEQQQDGGGRERSGEPQRAARRAHGAPSAAPSAGSRSLKRAPPVARLLASMLPPWSETMRCTIERPRPVPPWRRVKNGSNRWGRSWIWKPGPSSSIEHSSQRAGRVARELGPYVDRAASRGVLDRVLQQVAQHLAEPPLVHPQLGQVGRDLRGDRHPGARSERSAGRERVVDHVLEAAVTEPQPGRLSVLEQVVHQVGQAVELLAEEPHVLAVVVLPGEARLEGVERGADPEERVPDLVRHACDQRAEGGHRVAPPQLALRLDALGDVARERRQELDLAVGRAVGEHHLQHGDLAAVRAPQAALPAPGAVAQRRRDRFLEHAGGGGRRVELRDVAVAERLVVADPEHAPPGAVQVERAPGGVAGADEIGGRLEDRDQPCHRLLGARPLGDVAEAVDAAHHLAGQALRQRVALDHAPVAQAQRVEAFRLGLRVELSEPVEEVLGLLQLIQHEAGRALGVPGGQQLGREPPHCGEPLIEARDPAVAPDHQDPVGRRLQRRLEQRERAPALLLRPALLRHVPQVQHHAGDGRGLEAVHDLERAVAQRAVPVLVADRAPCAAPRRRAELQQRAAQLGAFARLGQLQRRAADELVRPIAGDALARRAHVAEEPLRVHHADRVGAVLHERAEALLTHLLRVLGAPQGVELAREIEPAHQQRPAERYVAAELRQRGRRRAQQDRELMDGRNQRDRPDRDDVSLACRLPVAVVPAGRVELGERPAARAAAPPSRARRVRSTGTAAPTAGRRGPADRCRRRARDWTAARRRGTPPSRARARRRAAARLPWSRAAATAAPRAASAAAGCRRAARGRGRDPRRPAPWRRRGSRRRRRAPARRRARRRPPRPSAPGRGRSGRTHAGHDQRRGAAHEGGVLHGEQPARERRRAAAASRAPGRSPRAPCPRRSAGRTSARGAARRAPRASRRARPSRRARAAAGRS